MYSMNYYGHAETTINRIVEAFQAGKIPAALSQVFVHRSDAIPCRAWSIQNRLIVALIGGTSDARGFKQWQEVNRHVKAGAQAFHILAPCLRKLKETKPDGTDAEQTILYGFRTVPVFALEQTNGEPLPADQESNSFLDTLPLRDVAKTWGISVESYNGRDGVPLGKYRREGILGTSSIALGVENLSTWAHELCHASDDKLGSLDKSARPEREVVAELAGCTLLECLGYHTESDAGGAWQYILGWSDGDRNKALRACLKVIERAANVVANILDTAETMRRAA
jgi:hypothetical protein